VNLDIVGSVPVDPHTGKIQKFLNQLFFSRPFHGNVSVSGESEDRKMGQTIFEKLKFCICL
jgi:hypothetical protein